MTYEVTDSALAYEGRIFSVRQDNVVMPGGSIQRRDVVTKQGAVAIVAFNIDGEIALLHQYRHPLGRYLWELPAGLLDTDGETPLQTAQRELLEETGYVAADWAQLVQIAASPGFTDEQTTVFLAHDVTFQGRPAGADNEEADLDLVWTPIDEALTMVRDGQIVNAHTVAGILAMMAYSHTGLDPKPIEEEE